MDPKAGIPLHTGNKMPVLGLGTWQLTDDTAGAIAAALGLGYRLIDTAADYGTQPDIGEGIGRSGVKRSDVYLVTKVEETDDAYEAARKNLSELQLEYADLMLIHRPPRTGAGEDLWRGLIRAKEDGLTRDIGISNYSAGLIDALINATGESGSWGTLPFPSPLRTGHARFRASGSSLRGGGRDPVPHGAPDPGFA